MLKHCGKCNKDRPLSDFNSHACTYDKKQSICRDCGNKYGKDRYVLAKKNKLPKKKTIVMESRSVRLGRVDKKNKRYTTRRECLSCGLLFDSEGNFNRICEICKRGENYAKIDDYSYKGAGRSGGV